METVTQYRGCKESKRAWSEAKILITANFIRGISWTNCPAICPGDTGGGIF